MTDLRIRTKLLLLLALLLAGTLAAGAYGVFSLYRAQQASDESLKTSEELLTAVESSRSAQDSFKTQVHDFKNVLLRGHDQEQYDWYLTAFRKGTESVVGDFLAVEAAMTRFGLSTAVVKDARRAHEGIVQDYLEALKTFEGGKAETALAADRAVRGKDRQLDDRIGAIVHDLQKFAATEATRLRGESEAGVRRAIAFLSGLVVLLSVLAAGAGAMVVRRLQAELGGEPAYAKQVAERIAAGNLSVDVNVRAGDTTSVLFAMRTMSENLHRLVSEVSRGAATVALTSGQLAQGNAELSQRTEEQASTLEETAGQMEELTTTVTQNADHASQASRLALQACDVARKGGQVMGDMVGTMTGISDSSRRISDIIGVIEGIAFQTNILALNAAVEAARAGEHGRGFSVVAAEVRELSQRSAVAAKEIKTLIGDSVARVGAGTHMAGVAGKTMQEILNSVTTVSDLIARIAAANQEQSSGIGQVNGAIAQMEQAVQQNATMVEDAAIATGSMNVQAGTLLRMVEAFRLRERNVESAAPGPVAQRALSGRRAVPGSPRGVHTTDAFAA